VAIDTFLGEDLSLTGDVLDCVLKQYLTREEFEQLFHTTPEEFYFLAEWKRNDLKKRLELF